VGSDRARFALLTLVVACAGDATRETGPGAPSPTPAPTNAAAGTASPTALDAGTPTAATGLAGPPCAPPLDDQDPAVSDALTLTPVQFSDLPGWADDHLSEAIPSFLASCAELANLPDSAPIGVDGYSGTARDWRPACAAAGRVAGKDDAAARAFFEREMTPYQAAGKKGPDGKMTSYDVQALRGSITRHGPYQVPIYKRPPDLVSVDLSAFIRDGKGRHLWGRIDAHGDLAPYATRAEIRKGALAGKNLELLWVDDPVDALFAQIEGSGKVTLDDGKVVWIEFDGKNGRAYRGVGKVLRDTGELKPGEATMQGIRGWFASHPAKRDDVIDQDASFVFFKLSQKPGAVGTQHVILTPQRSAAVDHAFVAFSTPIWIDTRAPIAGATGTAPWRHLGPVRVDLYWGDDEKAADVSGRMGGPGREWFLLPRRLTLPAKVLAQSTATQPASSRSSSSPSTDSKSTGSP
jgi:membrane-bound lytic murein transglycosylase A